jgi:uncharacterized membrane protein
MIIELVTFLLIVFLVLLLLVFGFETVGFTLSETLLIFIGSTILFLTSFPSILLYFRGSLGFGIIDVPFGVLLFWGMIAVGPKNELAVGFDLAGFLIPFFISLKMMIDHRSPIRASFVGVSVITVFC